jgi:hypothetical protein
LKNRLSFLGEENGGESRERKRHRKKAAAAETNGKGGKCPEIFNALKTVFFAFYLPYNKKVGERGKHDRERNIHMDKKKFDELYSETLYTLMSRSFDGFVPATQVRGAESVNDIRAIGDRMVADHIVDGYTVAGSNAIQCIGFEKNMAAAALGSKGL